MSFLVGRVPLLKETTEKELGTLILSSLLDLDKHRKVLVWVLTSADLRVPHRSLQSQWGRVTARGSPLNSFSKWT